MRQVIGIGVVILGVVLLFMGFNEADSFASGVSRFFTGNPTDRAIWFEVGGIVTILAGLGCTLMPLKLAKR